jgi:hypothetical protein
MIADNWMGFVQEVAQEKAALAAALEEARVSPTDNGLKLIFNKTFTSKMVSQSWETLKPLLTARFGFFPALETAVEEIKADKKQAAPSPALAPPLSAEPDVTLEAVEPEKTGTSIQKALKHFPGLLRKEKKKS